MKRGEARVCLRSMGECGIANIALTERETYTVRLHKSVRSRAWS